MKLSEALQPHLKGFYEIISGCFEDYKKFYSPEAKLAHDLSCRSHNRNAHMRERASRYATKTPDVATFESKGLRGILLNQCIAVLFKKLDEDRNPRNILTPHMEDFLNQQPIEGVESLVNLIAGYTEDRETGEMSGAFVIRPSGVGNNKWEWELKSDRAIPVVQDLFEDDEEIEEAEVIRRRETAKVIPISKEDDGE